MNTNVESAVEECSRASEDDALTFPQILVKLAAAGVESYYADLRRAAKVYYLPTGDSIEVAAAKIGVPAAAAFDAARVEAAVRQSQAGAHTYKVFCEKVMAAGCAAYFVSLLGRRVVYFGRSGETHVEHFPAAT